MDSVPDNAPGLDVLAGHLAVLPIEAHLADDQAVIEDCRAFLMNALRFFNRHRSKVGSVEALTTILSYDYHQVMKTGSRELRHLLNIYEGNQSELEKVRRGLSSDSTLSDIDDGQLAEMNEEGREINCHLSRCIDSAIAALEGTLGDLKKASVKLWDRTPLATSVIPKDSYFFVSHATQDKELAVAMCAEIESVGITTWRDDKDIDGGDSIPTEIAKGIERASHFGLLYSKSSQDRPWVRTEFENALVLRERTGRPKIIPLLLDGLMPPTMLGNIRGIPFDNFRDAMEFLWRSLGVSAGSRVSLDTIFKFQQKARKALECVKWCNQPDYQFLAMDEGIFDDLEDLETYILSFPLHENEVRRRRFEWTMVTFYDQSDARPDYERDFYTNRRGAIAGASMLRTIDGIARRLLALLNNIEGAPLPREVEGLGQRSDQNVDRE